MAITTTLSDQLSQVSQFQNEDIKIYVSSVDYNTLSSLYQRDKKNYEDNFNVNTTNNSMDIWQNSLAKTFAICAHGELIKDDETKIATFKDNGKYELVAFAADGRPIKITPSFTEIDASTGLGIAKDVDSNNNPYTYLYLDLPKISNWIADNEDSSINKNYKLLEEHCKTLENTIKEMDNRLKNIESTLSNNPA